MEGDSIYVVLAGSALAGVFTTLGAWWHARKQRNDDLQDKRVLLSGLLGDEITMRWKGTVGQQLLSVRFFRQGAINFTYDRARDQFETRLNIGGDFTSLSARTAIEKRDTRDAVQTYVREHYDVTVAQRLCNVTKVAPDDLPIVKSVFERFSEFNVFYDKFLLSEIIYVHVLLRDFCDALERLTYHLGRIGEGQEDVPEAMLKDTWMHLGYTLLKIDAGLSDLYLAIRDDYATYKEGRRHEFLAQEFL